MGSQWDTLPPKMQEKIMVYKEVAETIERSHRWPERLETF